MAPIHMTEAELQSDLHAVLERVRRGAEVVVEGGEPVILTKQVLPRRTLGEALALLPKDSPGRMDADFARDVEAAVEAHREPLDTSAWD